MKNQSNIRNFCIISHIDHGKSTLSDRFLELTGTIEGRKMRPQFLDKMDLEREKGITIKMQPCRMAYQNYILNLIDTPGHIDFSYEVSRSLAAVEGAILLVDAFNGIQAQTLANLELALKQNVVIIPVVNKIDLRDARTEEVTRDLSELLNIDDKEIIKISAKYGTNVEEILDRVIEKIPSPIVEEEKPLRALIFDSKYDSYKGVIAYIRLFDGSIKKGDDFYLISGKIKGDAKEVGIFNPEMVLSEKLKAGEIGYLITGIKEPGKVKVGDTITRISNSQIEPLSGYREPKPMVWASIYPEDPDDYQLLKDSLHKLKLNDPSFLFEPEFKEVLGRGFCCGFLGALHIEIISERIKREFGLNVILSIPSVVFKIINKKDEEVLIYSPRDWPEASEIKEIQEPYVRLEVITPEAYLGRIIELCQSLKGERIEVKYFKSDKVLLAYSIPLREIIVNFYDKLKGVSQGFASMSYESLGYKKADLVKLDILLAGQKEDSLSKIVPRPKAYEEGKKMVKKLKEVLPTQLFSVAIQASISGKIIARENISVKGKDVIAPLYGGDYSRKKKLLEKQKKGKKKLKEKSKLKIPPNVFLKLFKDL